MKKRWSALVVVGLVLMGVAVAQPASASVGSWRPQGSSFTIPSNWHCGTTQSGPKLSAQTCLVRSGNYVQTATIVRNRTSSLVLATVYQQTANTANVVVADGTCEWSGVGANSYSVCFTETVISPYTVRSYAYVGDQTNDISPVSPWA